MIALRLLVLALGVALGVYFPFLSVILAAFGFSAGEIGIIAAAGGVGFAIAVPAWGHLADVRLGRTRTLQVCAVGGAVAALVLLGPWPAIVVTILFIAIYVFESAWQPLADAVTVNAVRGRDYARIRLLTSFTFAASAIVAGFIYDRTGYLAAFVLFAVFGLVMAVAAAAVPDVARADLAAHAARVGDRAASGRARAFGSMGVALRVAPRLWLVLAAVALLHLGIMSGFTFLPLRLEALGAAPSAIAIASGGAAALEIPTMLGAAVIARRVGLRGLFMASALIYAFSLATWTLGADPALLIATRILTGVGFAGVVVGVVLTVAALLPADLQATGQALYQTTAFGLAAVLANVVGGILYDSVGHVAVFGLGSAMSVAAAAVAWFAFPRDAGTPTAGPAATSGDADGPTTAPAAPVPAPPPA